MYKVKKIGQDTLYAMKVIRKDVVLESDVIESIIKERMVLIDVVHPFMVSMKYGF